MNYILLPRLWLARHVQNQSRITPMRRIFSFSRIFLFLDILGLVFFSDFFLRPYGAGYTPARDNPQIVHRVMVIRKDQSAVKAHINSHKNKISEEQIRRIGVIRD